MDEPSIHQAWLVVYQKGEIIAKHSLEGQLAWNIGRSKECDIPVPDRYVSRIQAVLKCIPGAPLSSFTIQDISSRNGTLVNGIKAEGAVSLFHGDIIMMGDTDLVFRCPGLSKSMVKEIEARRLSEQDQENGESTSAQSSQS